MRFGLVVTRAESAAVGGANRARQRMASDWGALFQGLEVRAGVALAPVWEGIATGFDKAINLAQPLFEAVRAGFDEIGHLARWFVDGFNAGLERFGPTFEQVFNSFQDLADVFRMLVHSSSNVEGNFRDAGENAVLVLAAGLKMVASVTLEIVAVGLNLYQTIRKCVEGVDTFVNGLRNAYTAAYDAARGIADMDPTGLARAAFDALDMPRTIGEASNLAGRLRDLTDVLNAVNAARDRLNRPAPTDVGFTRAIEQLLRYAEAQVRARAAAQGGPEGIDVDAFENVTRDLERQQRQAAMTAAAFHSWQLEVQGASEEQLIAADNAFRALQRTQSALANRSPLELFNDELARLNELWFDAADGVEGYARAAYAAFERLEQAAGGVQVAKNPTGVALGSREAIQAVNRYREEERANDPRERAARTLAAIEQQGEARQRTLQAILEELRAQGVDVLDIAPGGD